MDTKGVDYSIWIILDNQHPCKGICIKIRLLKEEIVEDESSSCR
jgi:hypothetical protein